MSVVKDESFTFGTATVDLTCAENGFCAGVDANGKCNFLPFE